MNQLLEFLKAFWKYFEGGSLPDYPDPPLPPDLGSALTQSEIDFVKKLKKEIEERFNPL